MTESMYPLRPMTDKDEKQVKKRLKKLKRIRNWKPKLEPIWKGRRWLKEQS